MSGDQEPWVFRGGLTADLQVRIKNFHHIHFLFYDFEVMFMFYKVVVFYEVMFMFYNFQRLIPVDSGNDLFVYKAPEVPTSKVYTIRPYLPADEQKIYAVCRRTCKDGLEDSHPLPPTAKYIVPDR